MQPRRNSTPPPENRVRRARARGGIPATWRRLSAALSLVYLLAFTPAGLGLTSLLTRLDGGHECQWQETPAGRRLVLHHTDILVETTAPAASAPAGTHAPATLSAAGSSRPDHVFEVEHSALALSPNLSLLQAKAEGSSHSTPNVAKLGWPQANGQKLERPPPANRQAAFGRRTGNRPVPVAFTVLLL